MFSINVHFLLSCKQTTPANHTQHLNNQTNASPIFLKWHLHLTQIVSASSHVHEPAHPRFEHDLNNAKHKHNANDMSTPMSMPAAPSVPTAFVVALFMSKSTANASSPV